MSALTYRTIHAIPAFIVGGFVWCLLSIVLSHLDRSVLGYFFVPGYSTGLILFSAAIVFFPLFFILRWLKRLNMATFPGGLAIATLVLVLFGEPASATHVVLLMVMAIISGVISFLVLRGGARADSRSKV